MKTYEISDAQSHLAEIIQSMSNGEEIILCEAGLPKAAIIAYKSTPTKIRNTTPHPDLVPMLSADYNASEPLSETEWPGENA